MGRLLTFCLSLLLLTSCQEHQWYKKEFSESEKPALAKSIRNGVSYHYQGSVPEQMHIREALAMDSSNGDFYREMGTARVKRGILDEMYYWYDEAAKRKPDPWIGFRGYLYLYFYRDYPRAIHDFNFQDSVMGMVGNSQAQDHDYMRGIAYYGMKDYKTALEFFDTYIERISAEVGAEWVDVYAHLYKALNHEKLDERLEAQEALNEVFALYPDLADAHYHQARYHLEAGNLSKAKESLKMARLYYDQGLYHNRPYVEVLDQIYPEDFDQLESLLTKPS